jgi:hypothetical protein
MDRGRLSLELLGEASNARRRWPVTLDFKDIRSYQCLKLLDCKRGILIEEGIGLQHGKKNIVGDLGCVPLRQRLALLHGSGNIVDSPVPECCRHRDFTLKGRGNNGREAPGIQRLAKIAAIIWYRKRLAFSA